MSVRKESKESAGAGSREALCEVPAPPAVGPSCSKSGSHQRECAGGGTAGSVCRGRSPLGDQEGTQQGVCRGHMLTVQETHERRLCQRSGRFGSPTRLSGPRGEAPPAWPPPVGQAQQATSAERRASISHLKCFPMRNSNFLAVKNL